MSLATRRASRLSRSRHRRILKGAPACLVRDCRGEGNHRWEWFVTDDGDAMVTIRVCARHYDPVADEIGDRQEEPMFGGPIPRGGRS